jgi:asparagine synthase (glutamine-hydrolysing)
VILEAYIEWGTECLHHFNGMFAIVIYDTQNKTLFAARDRFGVKPLYYHHQNSTLAIGSEIKQFTALPTWSFQPNGQRVYDFLNWGVMDHTAETMFAGVQQLSGGHYLHFQIDSLLHEKPQPKRWYTLTPKPFTGSFETAAETYKELLLDSIRLRLHADVDVGSCLSGGLDSSTIVCMAHELIRDSKEKLKTFTAGSDISRFDETHFVKAVIQKTGVESHIVIPQVNDLFETLSDLVWHQDEPFISTSIFAQWSIFKLVKENGIKVMLDGQGADEHLGGYHGFFANHLFDLLTSLQWGQLIIETFKTKKKHPQLPLLQMLANKLVPGKIRQHVRRLAGKTSNLSDWINPQSLGALAATPFNHQHSFMGQSEQQILHSSVPMLLHFEDRNSMAHSIESRTPFLDYRLVEFALGLPNEYKVQHGVTKRVLRKAAEHVLPEKILQRHDKMGFLTAEEIWFKQQSPETVLQNIENAIERSNGAINPNMYQRTQQMIEGKRPFDYSYWRALCYGAWLHRFVNKQVTINYN